MKYTNKSTICPYKRILLLFPELTKATLWHFLKIQKFNSLSVLDSQAEKPFISPFKEKADFWALSTPCLLYHHLSSIIKALLSFPIGNPDLIIPILCTYTVTRVLSLMPICWDGAVPARKQGVDRQLAQHNSFNLH